MANQATRSFLTKHNVHKNLTTYVIWNYNMINVCYDYCNVINLKNKLTMYVR